MPDRGPHQCEHFLCAWVQTRTLPLISDMVLLQHDRMISGMYRPALSRALLFYSS